MTVSTYVRWREARAEVLTECVFGHGSLQVSRGTQDGKPVVLLHPPDAPYAGQPLGHETEVSVLADNMPFPQVQLTFDTVEGLDALIAALQRTRAQMTGVLK